MTPLALAASFALAFAVALSTAPLCSAAASDLQEHPDWSKDGKPTGQKSAYDLLRHDATVEKAVRETLAEKPSDPLQRDQSLLRGDSYVSFRRQVDEATVPDCLHAEGLKRQPTFFLTGWLALPFIAVAKVRGKCQ